MCLIHWLINMALGFTAKSCYTHCAPLEREGGHIAIL